MSKAATVEPEVGAVLAPVSRTYYSRAANLVICINPGQKVLEDGKLKTFGEKLVYFTEQRDGYGILHTSDPEVMAALDKRNDVFDGQEYSRRIIPPEIRNQQLMEENQRIIEERNRLTALLQKQGKLTSNE